MRLRGADAYLAGLNDGWQVHYRGERVADLARHDELGIAARHAALEFALAQSPEHRALAVRVDESGTYSEHFHVPATQTTTSSGGHG